MRLVRLAKHPEAFSQAVYGEVSAGLSWLHFCELGRKYYTAVAEASYSDQSFMIEDGGRAIAVVECDIHSAQLGRFCAPLEIRFRAGSEYVLRKTATRLAMAEFTLLQAQHGFTVAQIATTQQTDPDGLVATSLLSAGAEPSTIFHSEIDLTLSDKAITDDYRSGHRQQMRWGEKNLSIVYVDQSNPDRVLFERCREFHAAVAGRVTRGEASWDAMFEFLTSGKGDLVTGFLGNDLVSATMILDANECAVYASGVYDRSRFDLPLAHYPLTLAILRAKQRGLRYFDVGEAYATDGDTKKQAIGYFKRGFSSRLNFKNVWKLHF